MDALTVLSIWDTGSHLVVCLITEKQQLKQRNMCYYYYAIQSIPFSLSLDTLFSLNLYSIVSWIMIASRFSLFSYFILSSPCIWFLSLSYLQQSPTYITSSVPANSYSENFSSFEKKYKILLTNPARTARLHYKINNNKNGGKIAQFLSWVH